MNWKKVLNCLLLILPVTAISQVKLPRVIRDSMILQRDAKVNIWGWAAKGEKVTVAFNGKTYRTTTGDEGKWQVQLDATKAGGPYTMQISGKNKIVIQQILMGDVWFCSGQSNMVHQMNIHDVTYANDIAQANYPAIRQFWIPTATNLQSPATDIQDGYWQAAVGENVRPFSAVAFFFARKLYEKYQVPIGIINASVGGTPIEAWTSENGLRDFNDLLATVQTNKDTAYVNNIMRMAANRPPVKSNDKGLTDEVPWYSVDYVPKGWRNINIPGYWEDQGIRDLNGTVWYRKVINLPASFSQTNAKLFLGRIVDADEVYINGKKIGNTTYQYPQRRYTVPAGVLQPGRNLFVIRVTNNAGKGGFVPDKPYCIFSGSDTIDLKGYWQYKVGDVFPSRGNNNPVNFSAQNQPTALYNAMVAPITTYTIKGILWYQGESNTGRAAQYLFLQKAIIADWRNQWKQGNIPFLYVQLPGFMDVNYSPEESNWAMLRDAQLKASTVPNAAMTVAIDAGEWNDIHPDNKKIIGDRLALAAQRLAYRENIVYSGPLYQSQQVKDGRIIISFTHTGSGLTTSDGEAPAQFAIAGPDKKFVWANAIIEGHTIIVWSKEITDPRFVRYAWADNPANPNLVNKEGLPAAPFRTDD